MVWRYEIFISLLEFRWSAFGSHLRRKIEHLTANCFQSGNPINGTDYVQKERGFLKGHLIAVLDYNVTEPSHRRYYELPFLMAETIPTYAYVNFVHGVRIITKSSQVSSLCPNSHFPDSSATSFRNSGPMLRSIYLSFFGVPSAWVAPYLSLRSSYSRLRPSDCFFNVSKSRSFFASSFFRRPISPVLPALASFSLSFPVAFGSPSYFLTFSSRRKTSRIIVYVRLRMRERKRVKPQRYMLR